MVWYHNFFLFRIHSKAFRFTGLNNQTERKEGFSGPEFDDFFPNNTLKICISPLFCVHLAI